MGKLELGRLVGESKQGLESREVEEEEERGMGSQEEDDKEYLRLDLDPRFPDLTQKVVAAPFSCPRLALVIGM